MAAVSPAEEDWVFTEELRGAVGQRSRHVRGHGDPVGRPALQLR